MPSLEHWPVLLTGRVRPGARRPKGPPASRQAIAAECLPRLDEMRVAAGVRSAHKWPEYLAGFVAAHIERGQPIKTITTKRRVPQVTITLWDEALEAIAPLAAEHSITPPRYLESVIDAEYRRFLRRYSTKNPPKQEGGKPMSER